MKGSQLLALAIFCVAVSTALAGGAMLISAVYSSQADAFLKDWKEKGEVPSEQAWQITHTAVLRANRFYPVASGALLDQKGRVLEWYNFSAWGDKALGQQYQQEAIEAYRQSLTSRPTWPFTWRNLALAKLRATELDEELYHTSERALHFGPFEKSVLIDVAGISFQEMRRDTRFVQLATTTVIRLSQWNAAEKKRIWQRVRQEGALLTICEALPEGFKREQKVCFGYQ